ncbi:hypothetical protein E3N88_01679 [Mikania micrantha]|uniref:DNA2/NAM7 helicase-like C-terminal domain-containing protein n=1 Tax=Mikania micrantha TaxID=192012 RepID=A0A5N6Q288_9ASTR|nr:hypothetical protein E3N88_01679 [Mikania micrantha]
MASSSSSWRKPKTRKQELIDVVFAWSIDDVRNKDLYKNKVPDIPDVFPSLNDYTKSFIEPLIEETHAELLSNMNIISRASTRRIKIVFQREDTKFPKNNLYSMSMEKKSKTENYEPEAGDLIVLAKEKPRHIYDLKSCVIASVQGIKDDRIQFISSKPILNPGQLLNTGEKSMRFAVLLMNLTTSTRIWQALHSDLDGKNMKLINKVLQKATSGFNLNASQDTAVWSCIAARECKHQETVNLIWGPPGTGKTKTVGCLLFALWKMKCCTLTCAPTNNAVLEATARFMSLVTGSLEHDTYGFGDIVLFGNGKRMKIDGFKELYQVFLENRVSDLAACLSPTFGWRSKVESMIRLLKSPEAEYKSYLCSEKKVDDDEHETRDVSFGVNKYGRTLFLNEKVTKNLKSKDEKLSIREYVTKRFEVLREQLTKMVRNLYTHMPTCFITLKLAKKMMRVISLIESVSISIMKPVSVSEETVKTFTELAVTEEFIQTAKEVLRETISFPSFADDQEIGNFCLRNACLIFCTASSSIRLHALETNVELLVVDEAGQLRECESVIPLQLPCLRDVVLIGDENQLPATVKSTISKNAGFGRSLFGRLVSLKHTRHLLNVQYRMHPNISRFPNKKFYGDQLHNGPNVEEESYKKQFLEGDIFGSYSFIHLAYGKVEFNATRSGKNMMEVAVIVDLVAKLHEESVKKNLKISVGCIAPYKAQVTAILDKIGDIYQTRDFSVKVGTVDGFQGCEEDVIIISTVTGVGNGSIGFLGTHERANVALTRARHCLWILGNGDTLKLSSPIWAQLVEDAKGRGCYHVAHEDTRLGQLITNTLAELGEFDGLFDMKSPLFKEAKWKVIFNDDFLRSIGDTENPESNKEVCSMLMKLSGGQHRVETVSPISELYNRCWVNSKGLSLVWSVDIVEENTQSVQVLRIWDILQGNSKLTQLIISIHRFYQNYNDETLNRCKEKQYDGDLKVPKIWPKIDEGMCLSNKISAMSLTKDEGSSSS